MKKINKYKLLRRIKITLLTGTLLFTISYGVLFTGWHTFGIIGLTGIINEGNQRILWLITLFFLFIVAGELVDYLLRHILTKKQQRLIAAMKELSDGEFSVRLQNGKRITDTGPMTVNAFNDMAIKLQNTTTLHNDFIGNFSHELKTPIGNINGFARVIRDSSLTEEEKAEYLDIIITESERLSNLSANILMLTRIEKQVQPEGYTEYNLTEQLRQITAMLYHKLQAKGIEITLSEMDFPITASYELMSQVWINLLDNAIKFSPENESITIDITKKADSIAVSIKNRGCTLKQEDISRIFDKFYQGEGEMKQIGNGLGLSVAKKITDLHGGKIQACADANGEFTITVSLKNQVSDG